MKNATTTATVTTQQPTLSITVTVKQYSVSNLQQENMNRFLFFTLSAEPFVNPTD